METAGSVLNYFEPFLGRIEILGGSKRIERVYFEIKESNIEQWEKPQIKVKNISFIDSFVFSYSLISTGFGIVKDCKSIASTPPYIIMVCFLCIVTTVCLCISVKRMQTLKDIVKVIMSEHQIFKYCNNRGRLTS